MTDGLTLSPFVYWAQTETHISLKIDLKDVKVSTFLARIEHCVRYLSVFLLFQNEPKVQIEARELGFKGHGHGARGKHDYQFNLSFYEPIVPDDSSFKVSDSRVDLNFKKVAPAWWPRLICTDGCNILQ